MKIIFEFDDLYPHTDVDCLSVIKEFINRYPNIILNFFVPPSYNNGSIFLNYNWCKELVKLIDCGNVCIGVHGCMHSFLEFKNLDYVATINRLKLAHNVMRGGNIPYTKVFRAPHWGVNQNTFDALIDLEYTHIYSHKDYESLNNLYKNKIKVIYYHWNLKDEFGTFENEPNDIIVAHGHTSPLKELSCGNSIYDQFDKICTFIDKHNPEFLRLDEI